VLAIGVVWGTVGRARASFGAAGVLIAITSLIPFFFIWLGVSLRLPHGDAPWKALVPGAVLVAAGIGLIHLGTVLVIAHYLERASATYGALGVSFTILMWLFISSRVIVASAMLNAVLWQRGQGPA
jgi:membrane protein